MNPQSPAARRTTLLIGLGAAAIVIAIIAYAFVSSMPNPNAALDGTGEVFCTQEAKLCPDGTYVGRMPPDCAFAACPGNPEPTPSDDASMKTYTDTATGVSYQYPETISMQYVSLVDWPPAVQVLDEPFTCTEGGSEIAQAGVTQKQVIDGMDYCVTRETEGAAGSVYTTYAYAFAKNDKTVILTFSVRKPQCGNYDEPAQSACTEEQASFNPDGLVATIVASLTMK